MNLNAISQFIIIANASALTPQTQILNQQKQLKLAKKSVGQGHQARQDGIRQDRMYVKSVWPRTALTRQKTLHLCSFLQYYERQAGIEGGTGYHLCVHSMLEAEIFHSLSSQQVRVWVCPRKRMASPLAKIDVFTLLPFLENVPVFPPKVTTFPKFSLPYVPTLKTYLWDSSRITLSYTTHVPTGF